MQSKRILKSFCALEVYFFLWIPDIEEHFEVFMYPKKYWKHIKWRQ